MSDNQIDIKVICPYCGHSEYDTVNYGTEDINCNKCGRKIYFEKEVTITVKFSKVYDKMCFVCDTYLFDEEVHNGVCPICKNSGTIEKVENYPAIFNEFNKSLKTTKNQESR